MRVIAGLSPCLGNRVLSPAFGITSTRNRLQFWRTGTCYSVLSHMEAFVLFAYLLESVLLSIAGWPWSCDFLISQPPKRWDYMLVPHCPDQRNFLKEEKWSRSHLIANLFLVAFQRSNLGKFFNTTPIFWMWSWVSKTVLLLSKTWILLNKTKL